MEVQHESVVEYAFCPAGACLLSRPGKRLRDVLELNLVEVCARGHKVGDQALEVLLLDGSRPGGLRTDRVYVEVGGWPIVGWCPRVSSGFVPRARACR